ncbi:MAG TPA: cold-shock protein, partial [Gammaproteobacteria bacterium]|nr:cold-shock protein [Gammaproteobacteria bacterium]
MPVSGCSVVFLIFSRSNYMSVGTVKWFNEAKGFGFIS